MKRRGLPSPAMVVALVALVMSVGGNVTAAVLITSADIRNNTIRGIDIRDNMVRGVDIRDNTVRGIDIRNKTVRGVDIRDKTVTSADVKDNTIRGGDIHDETIQSADVLRGSLTGADVANNSVTGADVVESSLATVPRAALATTAQNAARLDGWDANALTRVAHVDIDKALVLGTAAQLFGRVSITAPTAGFVMIHGGVTTENQSCPTSCIVTSWVRHFQSGVVSNVAQESLLAAPGMANTSHAWKFPVNAGVNTFELLVRREPGVGSLSAEFGELAALYAPFGPTGNGP